MGIRIKRFSPFVEIRLGFSFFVSEGQSITFQEKVHRGGRVEKRVRDDPV